MVIKIVLDACVLIDLDLDKIQLIKSFNHFLENNNNYNVLISQENFDEISHKDHYKMKKLLENTARFQIIDVDPTAFEKFSNELDRIKIYIVPKDRCVLFLGKHLDADFIVTSDRTLFEKVDRYRNINRIIHKQIPISTVGLMNIMFKTKSIDSQIFFEKSLALFKFKEIDNFFTHFSRQNLNVSGEKQLIIMDQYKHSLKERFQVYKDPLVDEYKNLKEQGLINI